MKKIILIQLIGMILLQVTQISLYLFNLPLILLIMMLIIGWINMYLYLKDKLKKPSIRPPITYDMYLGGIPPKDYCPICKKSPCENEGREKYIYPDDEE